MKKVTEEEKTKEKTELIEEEKEDDQSEPKSAEEKSLRARALAGANDNWDEEAGDKKKKMMRLLIICGVLYFAIDYIWSVVFVQDQDEITNAFRLKKDENGNIIHDVTKVVILYCKLCGDEGMY